jgi:hypothetical protein
MNDQLICHDMEMLCRQRAKVDLKHNWKWLGEADRWRQLGHNEIAWRFQQRNMQQMHAGPMAKLSKRLLPWTFRRADPAQSAICRCQ